MTTFDPAAWLAQYEAVGGAAHAIEWGEKTALQISFPRDKAGRGRRLIEELNAGNASADEGRRRNKALLEWLLETRGAVVAPADAG